MDEESLALEKEALAKEKENFYKEKETFFKAKKFLEGEEVEIQRKARDKQKRPFRIKKDSGKIKAYEKIVARDKTPLTPFISVIYNTYYFLNLSLNVFISSLIFISRILA